MSRDATALDVIEGRAQWCVVTGDCRDVLETLPAGCVDAVVTDPPYGVGAAAHGVTFRTSNVTQHRAYKPIAGDDAPFDPRPLLGIAPILCLWGANHYADKLPSRARWLIWDKRDGTGSNPLADCEMAWTSDPRPARLFSHRWMGMIRASEPGARWHPAQKPIRLLRWCMDTLEIPPGAVILDPYAGSGTTGVAAIQTGRRVILCEIDPTYADIARDRCERAAMQPRLIPDAPPPRVETLALDFEAVAQ